MPYKLVRHKKREQSEREKRAHAWARSLGFTDEERHELARMLPTIEEHHDGSWKLLTEEQFHDMLTMFEGFVWITHMMQERDDQVG
jgi:hypothetical protein